MQIRFHKTFERQLAKLPTREQEQLFKRMELFLENDRHPLLRRHSLKGEWAGCESLNVTGDLRAIVHVDEGLATFLQIGTHHQLYGA